MQPGFETLWVPGQRWESLGALDEILTLGPQGLCTVEVRANSGEEMF